LNEFHTNSTPSTTTVTDHASSSAVGKTCTWVTSDNDAEYLSDLRKYDNEFGAKTTDTKQKEQQRLGDEEE